ncbi:hypothetical protein CROQUDRAFT_40955 [Cronartium quercuum f. sp. fusiforme G11]|uniref:Type II methyltransferase M.TaqI-like domain-containing protein n=1 Tax=Cronartium quercuum f. sp. fusiforme G11 TaxID=708437 RepID=A0A9P6NKG9_9BASI|nr:hypothetical protein CROQUDRAFT_40955 [Cronartium quercuum f. sp. fusiforme G11]
MEPGSVTNRSVDSWHPPPEVRQFSKRTKFLTPQQQEAYDLRRLKAQKRVERKARAAQVKKDRAARRQGRKEQKIRDHKAELERLRQIRIAGDNNLKSGLAYFPTSIESMPKKPKKPKKPKLKELKELKKPSLSVPRNEDDHVNRPATGRTTTPERVAQSHLLTRQPPHLGRRLETDQPHLADHFTLTGKMSQPVQGSSLATHTATHRSSPAIQPTWHESAASAPASTVTRSQPQQSKYDSTYQVCPPARPQTPLSSTPMPGGIPRSISGPGQEARQTNHQSQSTSTGNHRQSHTSIEQDMHHSLRVAPHQAISAEMRVSGLDTFRNPPPHLPNNLCSVSNPTAHRQDSRASQRSTDNAEQFHPLDRAATPPVFQTLPLPDTGDFALKNQLVKMYMSEDGLTTPTPEHNQRSEVEFGWLKAAAHREIQRTRLAPFSPTSLSDHLKVQDQVSSMIQELLREWIGEYTVNKKPIAYIIGDIPFGNMNFAIHPPILIPRPETEEWTHKLYTVIQGCLECENSHNSKQEGSGPVPLDSQTGKYNVRILDIGAGSGCISNFLAFNLAHALVVGVDIDKNAVELSKRNAFTHGLTFFQKQANKDHRTKIKFRGQASFAVADLFSPSFEQEITQMLRRRAEQESGVESRGNESEGFDIIVSNPPYITRADYQRLPPSVKNWETSLAFIGHRSLSSDPQTRQSPTEKLLYAGSHHFLDKPTPAATPSLHPQTVTVMQELGLKLPKKMRESPSTADQEGQSAEKDDGLDFYRQIINLVSKGVLLRRPVLSDNAPKQGIRQLPRLVLEVGKGQAEVVKSLMLAKLKSSGIVNRVEIWDDFGGIGRVVVGFGE